MEQANTNKILHFKSEITTHSWYQAPLPTKVDPKELALVKEEWKLLSNSPHELPYIGRNAKISGRALQRSY